MRTRREQVALNDARAGVRAPSGEELVAGYVDEGLTSAELADRFGSTVTRARSMLCRYGDTRGCGRAFELDVGAMTTTVRRSALTMHPIEVCQPQNSRAALVARAGRAGAQPWLRAARGQVAG